MRIFQFFHGLLGSFIAMPTAAGFREFGVLLPKLECNFFLRVVAFFQTQMPSLSYKLLI